jgi:hypothetical protein
MFGHQDEHDDNQHDDNAVVAAAPPILEPSLTPQDDPLATPAATPAAGSTTPPDPKDVLSPAGGYPEAPSQRVHKGGTLAPVPEPVIDIPVPALKDDSLNEILKKSVDDLATIKIQALDELYPLIDKLDLTPDEKFRTLMMMIQASDNQELVKAAFEAAHNITDDKTKAQALLDIVNEINYFTQNPGA